MPSKPRKYSVKILWACESTTGYERGKKRNRVRHNFAQDVVMKASEPWYGTESDLCADNFFTSCSLAQQLL